MKLWMLGVMLLFSSCNNYDGKYSQTRSEDVIASGNLMCFVDYESKFRSIKSKDNRYDILINSSVLNRFVSLSYGNFYNKFVVIHVNYKPYLPLYFPSNQEYYTNIKCPSELFITQKLEDELKHNGIYEELIGAIRKQKGVKK